MMTDLMLAPAKAMRRRSRNEIPFKVTESEVQVPTPVFKALRSIRVTTACELVMFTHSFPSALVLALGCDREAVSRLQQHLVQTLQGRVPDAILHPAPVPDRSYGVPLRDQPHA